MPDYSIAAILAMSLVGKKKYSRNFSETCSPLLDSTSLDQTRCFTSPLNFQLLEVSDLLCLLCHLLKLKLFPPSICECNSRVVSSLIVYLALGTKLEYMAHKNCPSPLHF